MTSQIQVLVFITFLICLIRADSFWGDGDNWIEANLKASSFYQQLPSYQQDQLENIVENDRLTESQILQQLSQYGNGQLQGIQRQQFSRWYRQLLQTNQQFLARAQSVLGQLSSQAQPYGQQILQVLQNQNINPDLEDDQVNNIIRDAPNTARNELLNAWNQLQQYAIQQRQFPTTSTLSGGNGGGGNFGFSNDFQTMNSGYSGSGYSSTYGSGYNSNPRFGYARDQYEPSRYGNSGYGQSSYSSSYNQNYPSSSYSTQNLYSFDESGFPLPPNLSQYNNQYSYDGRRGYRPTYNQGYSSSGYGYGQSSYGQSGYSQAYGQSYGQANYRQRYGQNGYGQSGYGQGSFSSDTYTVKKRTYSS